MSSSEVDLIVGILKKFGVALLGYVVATIVWGAGLSKDMEHQKGSAQKVEQSLDALRRDTLTRSEATSTLNSLGVRLDRLESRMSDFEKQKWEGKK